MCRRTLLFVGLIASSLALSSGEAGQKKDAKKAPTATAATADYSALQNLGQIGGVLVDLNAGSRSLTLRVSIPKMEANPGYRPDQGNLMRRYQQIMNNPNPAQRQQQLQQFAKQAMQNLGNQPYKVAASQKDFTLNLQENVTVRKLFLGVEYDDTGNVKTYSKEKIAALRGNDPAKPGYAAKVDELQPGQEVLLLLAKSTNGQPEVRMIVMTREQSMYDPAPSSPGKKK